jgi:hypothetical protein
VPKCSQCGKNVKDAAKITTCSRCGRRLCTSCFSRHSC